MLAGPSIPTRGMLISTFFSLNSWTDVNRGIYSYSTWIQPRSGTSSSVSRAFFLTRYPHPSSQCPIHHLYTWRILDCLCCPWGRAFDWSCSPGGGDIWIFLRPTWRYLTADSDEKDWDRTYVSRFHASRMRRTVWKDQEVMEANENKRRLSGFHCFVFKFRLF